MKPIRVFGISLLCCAVASPVVADVTVKSKGTSAGMVGAKVGDMTQQIKGQKSVSIKRPVKAGILDHHRHRSKADGDAESRLEGS